MFDAILPNMLLSQKFRVRAARSPARRLGILPISMHRVTVMPSSHTVKPLPPRLLHIRLNFFLVLGIWMHIAINNSGCDLAPIVGSLHLLLYLLLHDEIQLLP
jgi:hypothetical protein